MLYRMAKQVICCATGWRPDCADLFEFTANNFLTCADRCGTWQVLESNAPGPEREWAAAITLADGALSTLRVAGEETKALHQQLQKTASDKEAVAQPTGPILQQGQQDEGAAADTEQAQEDSVSGGPPSCVPPRRADVVVFDTIDYR